MLRGVVAPQGWAHEVILLTKPTSAEKLCLCLAQEEREHWAVYYTGL